VEVTTMPLTVENVRNRLRMTVALDDCASRWGNEGLEAFSTPALIGYMENACVQALEPYLAEGEISVGASLTMKHLAPTPAGSSVEIDVKLTDVDGRRLTFSFEAYDEEDKIGEGEHERFVVARGKFEELLERKAAAMT
jgi:fluoroacetyl-CoA thioesterase